MQTRRSCFYCQSIQAEATILGNTDTGIGGGVINWKSHKEFYKVPKVVQGRCRRAVCHSTYHKGRDFYIVSAEKVGVGWREEKKSHARCA